MDLAEPYLNKGHRLFMDNFYSSPALYEDYMRIKHWHAEHLDNTEKGMLADLMTKTHQPAQEGSQHS